MPFVHRPGTDFTAGNYHLPIVLTTTDIRTPKVEQILANDAVQINW
jgi:hypothetical protein